MVGDMGVQWDVGPGGDDNVNGGWKGRCQGTPESEGGVGGERVMYIIFCVKEVFLLHDPKCLGKIVTWYANNIFPIQLGEGDSHAPCLFDSMAIPWIA